MKLIVFILALNIISLISAPAVTFLFVGSDCSEQCCEDPSESQNANSNCCNTLCNPFEYCSCCVNGEIKKSDYAFILDGIKNNNPTAAEINFSSTYLSDCWQPPELV